MTGHVQRSHPWQKRHSFQLKEELLFLIWFFFFAASVQRDSGQQADEAAGSEQQ